nr:MAG TPA_asm: hypothetical protein [Caudoviricetes sp.]
MRDCKSAKMTPSESEKSVIFSLEQQKMGKFFSL